MALAVKGLQFGYDAEDLFCGLDLSVKEGEVVALVGKNGVGKTTLLQLCSGALRPTAGQVMQKKELSMGVLQQIPDGHGEDTVAEVLEQAFSELRDIEDQLHHLEHAISRADALVDGVFERYTEMTLLYELKGGYDQDKRWSEITGGFGFSPSFLGQSFDSLSGGEKTRVLLARLLLENHDLLLLDEPTNHLDLGTTLWLERFLKEKSRTVLMVSHDRQFLNRTVSKIYEIADKKAYGYGGNYDAYREARQARQEKQLADSKNQQREMAKMEESIERFRRWGQQGDNAKFFKKAKQLERRLDQIEEIEKPEEERAMPGMRLATVDRASKEALRLEGLCYGFGEEDLFRGLDAVLFRAQRRGLVGDNGSGKTTLLKLLVGEEKPRSGRVLIGPSTKIAYLPQEVTFDDPSRTLLEEIRYGLHYGEQEARAHLARFGFLSEQVFRPLETLSGGERSRLRLSVMIAGAFNCLLLDEPTNHLDLPAREQLEEALMAYDGTLLVVSHDRYFLDKVVADYWIVEGGALVDWSDPLEKYYRPASKEEKKRDLPPEKDGGSAPKREKTLSPWALAEMEKEIEVLEIALFDLEMAREENATKPGILMDLTEQIEGISRKRDALLQIWAEALEEGEESK